MNGNVVAGPMAHGNPNGNEGTCGTCHMGQAFGEQAGGHTWKMKYEYHGAFEENIAGCKDCHSTLTTFNHVNLQTTVQGLLDELAVELKRIGVMTASESAKTGTWPADVAAAFVNWQMITEDRSVGVHNPPYVVGILNGSVAKMKTY